MKPALPGSASVVLLTASLLVASALGQNNPVPQVVGPPHPQAVAPGGGDFILKVYGANFVPGAVVNWNRQPRMTTYVSGHEVDTTILASDIVSNTAGYITVTNPPPGGGLSSASWSLVEVHDPTSAVTPARATIDFGGGATLLAADFTNDGILDLMVGAMRSISAWATAMATSASSLPRRILFWRFSAITASHTATSMATET